MLVLRLIFVSALAFCLDLGTAVHVRHWPFPVWTLLCVVVISMRRGEILAMILGWVLGMIYDMVNFHALGMTALILVLAAFSPWPVRKSRDFDKRMTQAALGGGNALVSFGVVYLIAAGRSTYVPDYGPLVLEALVIAALCALGLPALHALLARFIPQAGESGA